jgi:hypothetical protein
VIAAQLAEDQGEQAGADQDDEDHGRDLCGGRITASRTPVLKRRIRRKRRPKRRECAKAA